MIPKIIHHSAPRSKKKWHPAWEPCLKTWYDHFPESEYEHIMWDDEKIDCFIEEKFEKYYLLYHTLPFDIQRLDLFRYFLLYEYGGIYVDMDYVCVENFYDDFRSKLVLVQSTSDREIYQNSLMASEPKNEFWLQLIEKSFQQYFKYRLVTTIEDPEFDVYILITTGPILFTELKKEKDYLFDDVQMLSVLNYNARPEDSNPYTKSKCFHVLTGMWGKETWSNQAQAAFGNTVNDNYNNISDLFTEEFPTITEYLKDNLIERRNMDIDLGLDHYL